MIKVVKTSNFLVKTPIKYCIKTIVNQINKSRTHVINNRKIFPNDQSALKVVYVAIQEASQKWTVSLHD